MFTSLYQTTQHKWPVCLEWFLFAGVSEKKERKTNRPCYGCPFSRPKRGDTIVSCLASSCSRSRKSWRSLRYCLKRLQHNTAVGGLKNKLVGLWVQKARKEKHAWTGWPCKYGCSICEEGPNQWGRDIFFFFSNGQLKCDLCWPREFLIGGP